MATDVLSRPVSGPVPAVADLHRPISRWRRIKNRAWWLACGLGLVLVLIPVVWILAGVLVHAVEHWSAGVLTSPFTGTGGGLSNAIVGTFVLIVGVAILASAIGVGAGIYLAEWARSGRTTFLRSASELLAGIPSIVFGYVGYVSLVVYFHWGYSLYAALIVLSLLVVPYVAKATEVSINQVPVAYREGAEAVGMARTTMMRRIMLKAALPGITTGIVIAVAVSVGETAPLLYTAGWSNSNPTFTLEHSPLGYLTYAVWTFWDDPSPKVQALSEDAALLLVVLVLGLIIGSRVLVRLTQKHAPDTERRQDS
jgi:phosphate transport system permease protein